MSTFFNTLYRDLTCAAAAVAITLILSLSFLESTATAPGTRSVAGTGPHVALHA